jgi:hypothetical protein
LFVEIDCQMLIFEVCKLVNLPNMRLDKKAVFNQAGLTQELGQEQKTCKHMAVIFISLFEIELMDMKV